MGQGRLMLGLPGCESRNLWSRSTVPRSLHPHGGTRTTERKAVARWSTSLDRSMGGSVS